jgi:hypothetical protein
MHELVGSTRNLGDAVATTGCIADAAPRIPATKIRLGDAQVRKRNCAGSVENASRNCATARGRKALRLKCCARFSSRRWSCSRVEVAERPPEPTARRRSTTLELRTMALRVAAEPALRHRRPVTHGPVPAKAVFANMRSSKTLRATTATPVRWPIHARLARAAVHRSFARRRPPTFASAARNSRRTTRSERAMEVFARMPRRSSRAAPAAASTVRASPIRARTSRATHHRANVLRRRVPARMDRARIPTPTE